MKHFYHFPIYFLCFQVLSIHGSSINDLRPSVDEIKNSDAVFEKTVGEGKLSPEENEELQNRCGYYPVSKKKFHGSVAVIRRQAPWVVGMAIEEEHENISYPTPFCSASLISNRHVLSAWHCIEGLPLNQVQLVFDDDCTGFPTLANCSIENAIIIKATKVITPVLRTFEAGYRDLAIFELSEQVEYSSDLYPACLSVDNRTSSDTLDGALQHIQLETKSCTSYDSIDNICIKEKQQRSDHGDSGGGLIYKKYGKSYVTGVISGQDHRGIRKDVAVANHLSWICKHTGICVNKTKTEQIDTAIDIITPDNLNVIRV